MLAPGASVCSGPPTGAPSLAELPGRAGWRVLHVSEAPSPLPVTSPLTILLFLSVFLTEHPNVMVTVRTALICSHVPGGWTSEQDGL